MKMWRRENTKSLKNSKEETSEEFTDISQASTPLNSDSKKDKMEEIYSTKDKQVKYKRQTPLEAEAAAKRAQQAKEKLVSGKAEISLKTPEQEDHFVELTSDYEEGTVIADDIIEEVEQFTSKRDVHIQDIDEIDIDLEASATVKKYERQVSSYKRHDERYKKIYENEYERIFGKPKYDVTGEKIVAKIPTYQHESKINQINLKAGRFTDVVESEYVEYLKSNDPTNSRRAQGYHKPDFKKPLLSSFGQSGQKSSDKDNQGASVNSETATPATKKPKNKVSKFFRILGTLLFAQSANNGSTDYRNNHKTINYQDRQDSKQVQAQIKANFNKLALRCGILCLMFVCALVFTVMQRASGENLFSGIEHSSLIYCALNLLILLATGIVAWPFITSGLKPLRHFKGNSDTAISCAYIACLIQQIASLFASDLFVNSKLHIYTTIVTLGFVLNVIGRVLMVLRVKSNFKFTTNNTLNHVARIYNDEDEARKMLSGTTASRSVVAYQHPTNFLSDFLKISYAPDPSEDTSGKFAPITIVSAVFVSIVYGIMAKTFIGALCALAVMCCISIPLSALLCGNVPLLALCNKTLKHNAMLSGYPSVKQFADTNAVMVDATQLYPKGSIKLNTIKNFVDYRVEESLISAAMVLKVAKSPLYQVFEKVLKKNKNPLLKVESVLYEDKLGLVGWVNGERILIGNHKLLDRFHIYVGDVADETRYAGKGKNVTYIACAGQLVAMFVTTYTPDKKVKEALKKAQSCGLCLAVSTTDSNITAEKITNDYEIFYRTVKVVSTGFATTINELTTRTEDTSRAYLATHGDFSSLLHAITGCISFKQNMTIGLIVQICGLILGVLLCATIILYDSVSVLGVVEMLLYMLFWSIAAVVVQFIKRP